MMVTVTVCHVGQAWHNIKATNDYKFGVIPHINCGTLDSTIFISITPSIIIINCYNILLFRNYLKHLSSHIVLVFFVSTTKYIYFHLDIFNNKYCKWLMMTSPSVQHEKRSIVLSCRWLKINVCPICWIQCSTSCWHSLKASVLYKGSSWSVRRAALIENSFGCFLKGRK